MCFDYCSAWKTSVAEAHALVYDKSSNVSTSYENSSWKKNAPSTKAVMGMPAYSRTWQLKDANDHDIEAPAGGVGPRNEGITEYEDMVDFKSANKATMVYDNSINLFIYWNQLDRI